MKKHYLLFLLAFIISFAASNIYSFAASSAGLQFDSVGSVSGSSATLYGRLISNGGDNGLIFGFFLSTTSSVPKLNGNIPVGSPYPASGVGIPLFVNKILTPNTQYYGRMYAISSANDTIYSNVIGFKTKIVTPAILKLDSINSITVNTATFYGRLIDNGNDPSQQIGVVCNTSTVPSVANGVKQRYLIGGPTVGQTISFFLTGFNPNTKYYCRFYSINTQKDTSYSSFVAFTTLPKTPGTLMMDSITDVGSNQATLNGHIITKGNCLFGAYGYLFSTNTIPSFNNNTNFQTVGQYQNPGNYLYGNANYSFSGLNGNTKYYGRMYVICTYDILNKVNDTIYSNIIPFKTLDYYQPVVATDSNYISNYTSINVTPILLDNGRDQSIQGGIVFSTSSSSGLKKGTYVNANLNSYTGLFQSIDIPFKTNTKGFYRAFAINRYLGKDTVYGAIYPFTTKPTTPPQFLSDTITNLQVNSANFHYVIHNFKAPYNNNVSFISGTLLSTTPAINLNNFVAACENLLYSPSLSTKEIDCPLSNLTSSTTYFVRAYAIDTYDTVYSSVRSFVLPSLKPLGLSLDSVNNVGAYSANTFGHVVNNGNYDQYTVGLVIHTITNPSFKNGGTAVDLGAITNLVPNTKYYGRIYGYHTNFMDTTYGNTISFTTKGVFPANPKISKIGKVHIRSASVFVTATNAGSASSISVGLLVSTTPDPNFLNNIVGDVYTTNVNAVGVTDEVNFFGLEPNTKYYIKTYALSQYVGDPFGKTDTTYGNIVSVQTLGPPALNIDSANSTKNAYSLDLYGDVQLVGGDTAAAVGFCYGTNPGVTINDNVVYVNKSNGQFSGIITGLAPGTQYYIRSFANSFQGDDFTYSNEITGTTLSLEDPIITLDSIRVGASSIITYITVKSLGNDTILSHSGIAQYQFVGNSLAQIFSTENTADNYFKKMGSYAISWGSAAYPYPSLNHNVENAYLLKAYAVNSKLDGNNQPTEIFSNSLGYYVNSPTVPTVITDTAIATSATTLQLTGNVTFDGFEYHLKRGFYISENPDPINTGTYINDYSINLGLYTLTVGGLKANTTYYVQAFTSNYANAYSGFTQFLNLGDVITVTSLSFGTAAITTDSLRVIPGNSAILFGNISQDGNDPNISAGFLYGTASVPSFNAQKISDVHVGKGLVVGTVTGLTGNVPYFIRSYAIYANQKDTVFGEIRSFAYVPALITTDSVNSVSINSSKVFGSILQDGYDPSIKAGIVYGINALPTFADNVIANLLIGKGSFTSSLTGLNSNTTYYVRTFAIYGFRPDTLYGNTISFKTGLITDLLQSPSSNPGLTLYPNPTQGQVQLSFSLETQAELTIELINGQGMPTGTSLNYSANAGINSTLVNLSGFSNGLYYVLVKQNGQLIYSKKVIKLE